MVPTEREKSMALSSEMVFLHDLIQFRDMPRDIPACQTPQLEDVLSLLQHIVTFNLPVVEGGGSPEAKALSLSYSILIVLPFSYEDFIFFRRIAIRV